MADIFMSYSREDRPKAEQIARALEAEGFSIWWDKVLRAGQSYDQVTEEMLGDSVVAIVLWSKISVKSNWVRSEATLGQRECTLVPAMIEDAKRPIMFELVQSADLVGWDGDTEDPRWSQFVDDIRLAIERAKPPKPEPEPDSKKAPKGNLGWLKVLALLILIAASGGAYFHFFGLNIPGFNKTGFSDCKTCPQMLQIEGGVFEMGSAENEPGRTPIEGPVHLVQVSSFALSETEVTFAQWDACVADGGCSYSPSDGGFGRGNQPVIGVSWNDAKAYIDWLSKQTGRTYRLPTESEWEYAARAGTQTAYWWGDTFSTEIIAMNAPQPVQSLKPNGYGLKGMLGNAREWVEDCYVNSYLDAPIAGEAQTNGDCSRRVLRGGAWSGEPEDHRSANRARTDSESRASALGFRVATSDTP